MKKILEIIEQKEINTYLNYSLVMCSLLWNPNKLSWLNEHFTNIYLMRESNNYIWFDYLESSDFMKDVMEYSNYNVETMKNKLSEKFNLVDYIIDSINNEYYVTVFVDGYFLDKTSTYQKEHQSVQSFIYGYCEEELILYGIGFREDGSFGKIEYNFESFLQAAQFAIDNYHLANVWVDWFFVTRTKIISPDIQYEFEPKTYLNDLKSFINSEGSKELLRKETKYEKGDYALYGFKAQEELINAFNELLDGNFVFDYRCIHLLVEHKELMMKKMMNTAISMGIEEKIKNVLDNYKEITEEFKEIRMVFLKNVMIDNNMETIYGQLTNKKVIKALYNKLVVLSNKEYEVLNIFLDEAEKTVVIKT